VTVICEWKSAEVETTETKFDASLVLDAAARAEKLWDLPEPPAGHGRGVDVIIS
jgi:hypothetical protein